MKSANTAAKTNTSMIAAPASPSGCDAALCLSFTQMLSLRTMSAAGPGVTSRMAMALRQPDARIEHRVEKIDEEIDRDRDHRDEHHQILHDRIIAPTDRFDEEACDPGNVEHGLGHDQPAHQERGLNADH